MQIKNYKKNNIEINYVQNDMFKKVSVMLTFKRPITNKMFMINNMLSKILVTSSNKYNTNRDLNINCMGNYNAKYITKSRRDGIYSTFSFYFSVLNDEFTEKGNLKKVIDTFNEIIFYPKIKDKKFDEDEFNLIYKQYKIDIVSEKEDAQYYINKKISQKMGLNTPISYANSLEILNKITNEDLYNGYLDLINNSEISLYITGDNVDLSLFDSTLEKLKSKKYELPVYIDTKINKKINITEENYNGYQSLLMIGIKLKGLSKYQRSYVVPVYNNILGSGASSILFDVVREKNSLCYFINSRYEKDDNIIYITAGIEKESYEKTKKLILDIIKNINAITKDEIDRTKKDIVSYIKEGFDEPINYLLPFYYSKLYDEDIVYEKINKISRVTLNDVHNLSNNLFVTDIYFLRGCGSN